MRIDSETEADTPTGHVVGRTYLSREFGQLYTVERATTLWECAPGGAVVRRWENGNETTCAGARGLDPEVCRHCRQALAEPGRHWCYAAEPCRAAVA